MGEDGTVGFSRPSELIPITEGIENSNYKFIADGKAYVFTIFEVWKMPQIEYYVQLMRHLAKNKMPVAGARFARPLCGNTNPA